MTLVKAMSRLKIDQIKSLLGAAKGTSVLPKESTGTPESSISCKVLDRCTLGVKASTDGWVASLDEEAALAATTIELGGADSEVTVVEELLVEVGVEDTMEDVGRIVEEVGVLDMGEVFGEEGAIGGAVEGLGGAVEGLGGAVEGLGGVGGRLEGGIGAGVVFSKFATRFRSSVNIKE